MLLVVHALMGQLQMPPFVNDQVHDSKWMPERCGKLGYQGSVSAPSARRACFLTRAPPVTL